MSHSNIDNSNSYLVTAAALNAITSNATVTSGASQKSSSRSLNSSSSSNLSRGYSRHMIASITRTRMSPYFLFAVAFFSSTLLASFTTPVEAIPVISVPASDLKASTFGCPSPDNCIEHCKTMNSKGYCGEYPQRSCFCTL